MERMRVEMNFIKSHLSKLVLLVFCALAGIYIFHGGSYDYSGLWIGTTTDIKGEPVVVVYHIERDGFLGDYDVYNDTYSLPSLNTHHLAVGAIIRDKWIINHSMDEANGVTEGQVMTIQYAIMPITMVLNDNLTEIHCSRTVFHEGLILRRGTPSELEDLKNKVANERKEFLQAHYQGITYSATN